MSGIPTDEEMQDFSLKLKKMGLSEAEQKLIQGAYRKGDWKHANLEKFISNEKTKYNNKLAREHIEQIKKSNKIASDANEISKHSNKIAYWALGGSVIAMTVSILVAFFK